MLDLKQNLLLFEKNLFGKGPEPVLPQAGQAMNLPFHLSC